MQIYRDPFYWIIHRFHLPGQKKKNAPQWDCRQQYAIIFLGRIVKASNSDQTHVLLWISHICENKSQLLELPNGKHPILCDFRSKVLDLKNGPRNLCVRAVASNLATQNPPPNQARKHRSCFQLCAKAGGFSASHGALAWRLSKTH